MTTSAGRGEGYVSRKVSSGKSPITDANVRGLIRHYDRMDKLHGARNYDLTARLLRELLQRRNAK